MGVMRARTEGTKAVGPPSVASDHPDFACWGAPSYFDTSSLWLTADISIGHSDSLLSMGWSTGSVWLLLLIHLALLRTHKGMKLLACTLVIKVLVAEPGMITQLGARRSL